MASGGVARVVSATLRNPALIAIAAGCAMNAARHIAPPSLFT